MEQRNLIVCIKYNQFSGKFFVDFSDENGYIVSIPVNEGQATGLSRSLDIKIMHG